ncbi:hypothetical protein Trydic_g12703 [Trypoxylus dichotomus]
MYVRVRVRDSEMNCYGFMVFLAKERRYAEFRRKEKRRRSTHRSKKEKDGNRIHRYTLSNDPPTFFLRRIPNDTNAVDIGDTYIDNAKDLPTQGRYWLSTSRPSRTLGEKLGKRRGFKMAAPVVRRRWSRTPGVAPS